MLEGVDLEPFIKFNKHNIAGGNSSRNVVTSALKRDKGITPASSEHHNGSFYICSMGHRIQFIDYDAENSQVILVLYVLLYGFHS